jgi:hypothetical protein
MENNESVMWFFADDNGKVVDQVLLLITEEERAIDIMSVRVPRGRYMLGYFRNNGEVKTFNNARQIV